MASNFQGFTTVFLLSVKLLFFTLVSSQYLSPGLAPPRSSCSGQELVVRFSAPSGLNSPCCRHFCWQAPPITIASETNPLSMPVVSFSRNF
ncbi:hypothetical protein V6N13_093524 [Hibiscus sabdariffa]